MTATRSYHLLHLIRRVVLRLAVLGSVLGSAAHAEERTVEASQMFPKLELYLALPPDHRDRFQPRYVLYAKSGDLRGVEVWILLDGRRTSIPVSESGLILRLPNRSALTRGMVQLVYGDGARIGLRVELQATLPASASLEGQDLERALAQANEGIRSEAGLLAFLTPGLNRYVFEGGEYGEVIYSDGRRAPLPLIDGQPCYEAKQGRAISLIRLGRAPTSIVMKTK